MIKATATIPITADIAEDDTSGFREFLNDNVRDWVDTVTHGPRYGPWVTDLGPVHEPTRATLRSNRYHLFNMGRPGRYIR